jgi:hypothetical protein
MVVMVEQLESVEMEEQRVPQQELEQVEIFM